MKGPPDNLSSEYLMFWHRQKHETSREDARSRGVLQCELCRMPLTNWAGLRLHLLHRHKLNPRQFPSDEEEFLERATCELCHEYVHVSASGE